MQMKLAILAAGQLLSYIKAKLQDSVFKELEVSITALDYRNFSYISQLYTEIELDYDGFLICGTAAYHALEKGVLSLRKPTVIFEVGLESIYYSLLDLLRKNRSLDLKRVVIDIFLPFNTQNTAESMIELDEPGFKITKTEVFWKDYSLDELKSIEDHVFNLILDKWEHGEIDYVLSRYSTIYPRLVERQIPCTFVYSSVYQLLRAVKDCISAIDIAGMKEYMPGVIAVFRAARPSSDIAPDDMDMDVLTLQKALLEFNKEYLTDYQLQKHLNGFYIFTNLKTLHRITGHFSGCSLSAFLGKHLDFKTDIAYGFAQDIAQARSNASAALRVSAREKHVYAMNESGTLLGPLDLDTSLIPTCELTPQLELLASRSRLSPLTIQKLKTIVDANASNEITIAELSEKLGVKQRNANRILTNLLQSQDAEIIGARASGTKGRPTKVYRLLSLTPDANWKSL